MKQDAQYESIHAVSIQNLEGRLLSQQEDISKGIVSKGMTGTLIRAHRVLRGLRLRDLSAMTGLAVSTLSRIERGQRSLTLPAAARILQALTREPGRDAVRSSLP